jgi:hypothetical protein
LAECAIRRRRWRWVLCLAPFASLLLTPVSADALEPRAERRLLVEQDRVIARRTALMSVLTGWAGLNILGGGLLVAFDPLSRSTDPSRRSFRRAFGVMALTYGAVNLALGAGALASNRHHRETLASFPKLSAARERTATIFSANVGLDMVYVTTGSALWALGREGTARGVGAGFVTQGGFLLGLDVVGASLSRY